MKLKLNGKYQEVNIWSFLKCQLITSLLWLGILYGSLIALYVLIGMFFGY